MHKVSGAVDGVNDPSGVVGEDAGGPRCYGLLTYEAFRQEKSSVKCTFNTLNLCVTTSKGRCK